jgi:polar amino acid transport system ATP-binding protein
MGGEATVAIELRDIHKSFGTTEVLRGVDLAVRSGEVVVIIGPSGSGKSTLLRCMNRLEQPDRGKISIGGVSMRRARNIDRVRARVGMVFQAFNLFPHLTVLENACLAQRVVKRAVRSDAERVARELLEKVGIPDKADRYPSELSGGQQQRAAIARALAMRPEIMLFDEPTSALDPEMIREVLKVMLDLAKEGMTMVVVSHEMGFARAAAHRLVFLDAGKVLEDGPPAEVFARPRHARTQEFLCRILPSHGG